jgi:hypothetical protein
MLAKKSRNGRGEGRTWLRPRQSLRGESRHACFRMMMMQLEEGGENQAPAGHAHGDEGRPTPVFVGGGWGACECMIIRLVALAQ